MRSLNLALPFRPVLLVPTGEATETYIGQRSSILRLQFVAEATGTQNIIGLLKDAEAEIIVIQGRAEIVVD